MSFGTNAPIGFVENVSKISATLNVQSFQYDIETAYATAIYTGDPVTSLSTGFIGRAVAGSAVCGVFKGVTFQSASTNEQIFFPYWPASTATKNSEPAKAYIIDDPNVVFTIQTGSPGITNPPTLTRTFLNLNANFNFGAGGNTYNGLSGCYLDMDTVAATATLNCKILALTPGFTAESIGPNFVADNILGQNYNNANVIFNNHQFKGGTGTLGV